MSDFFIRRPIFAIVLSIMIVLLGLLSLVSLPVEQYPEITPSNIQVNATYSGADAVATDEAVATPISEAIVGVDNMLYIQSISSSSGEMSINVAFSVDSDADMDAIFTQNNVETATPLLPSSVQEQGVTTTKSSSSFLMVYALYSDGRYDDLFLSNYAAINIENELLQVDGVGNVQVLGAGPYSMRIWVDVAKLKYMGVSISDITSAIEAQSGVYATGKLGGEPNDSKTEFTYTVTIPSEINTAEEYAKIVLRSTSDGSVLRLGDVARIELGSLTYGTTSKFNGAPSVLVAVYQAPGSNAMSVGEAVNAKMQELKTKFYDGIDYRSVVDAPAPIKKGIRDIIVTLFLALVLVVAIVFLFIQRTRAMVVPLVAIPVSLIGAFMLYPFLGISINVFSLLGLILAIGLVVDDAIVVVEAVQLNLSRGLKPKEATQRAMKMVASPIIATSLSLVAVFVPVAFISGIEGELFRQFSITIALAVAISAFNALTLSPALCAMLLKEGEEKTKGFFGWFNRWFKTRTEGYLSFTKVLSRHAGRSVVFVGVLILALFFSLKGLPSGLLPVEDEGYFMIAVQLPDASSVERTEEALDEVRDVVMGYSAVESVATLAGFDMMSQVSSTNSGIVFVQLKDYSERSLSAGELVERLQGELYMEVGGGEAFAFQPPAIPGLGTASGVSFVVQDRGGNTIEYLGENADNFIAEVKKLPQISALSSTFSNKVPQRMIEVNVSKAIYEGVDIAELKSALGTLLGGTYINNFNRFGQIYETYIGSESTYRQTKNDIELWYIENSSGEEVPISSFVEIRDTLGVEFVEQFNLFRSVSVNASCEGGYSSSQAMDAIEKLAAEKLPEDMAVAWNGVSFIERQASGDGLFAFVIAFVFVFLILSALYESWITPLSILTGVPIAAFGAVAAVLVAREFVPSYADNVFMQISLILLIGLSAKNAILIVEYASVRFFEEGEGLLQSVMEAAQLRLRPILMTALAFLFGVMPLVFAGGPTEVAQNTLGMALVGGTITSTLLGIFVYPLLYLFFARLGGFERVREKRNLEKDSPSKDNSEDNTVENS